jgi:ATP-dependent Lon protease
MRAGIEQVIIPKLNEKDLPDLPEEVKQKLKITPVEDVDAVLAAALEEPTRKAVARESRAVDSSSSGSGLQPGIAH